MYDLNCPCCGTTFQSITAGSCECCGYEFTDEYINEFIAKEKKKENEIEEKIAEEKRQQQLLLEQQEAERQRQEAERRKKEEEERKAAIKKEKQKKRTERKRELSRQWLKMQKYSGIIITAIFVLLIIYKTVIMKNTTGIPGGWILFIVLTVVSFLGSVFCCTLFDIEDFTAMCAAAPAGTVGAFVASCIISDLWKDMVVEVFSAGFFAVIMGGLITLVIFGFLVAVSLAIIACISHVLTAKIMCKLGELKGGLASLGISLVAAMLYFVFFDKAGVNFVLGQ